MLSDIREFWWTKITGPNYVVNRAAVSLMDYKNVVLNVPSDLPWRQEMRGALLSLFRQQYANFFSVFETIDVSDECPDEDPGRYLLNRYGDRDTKNDFREGSKYTFQTYLIAKKVLKNRIVWLKGLSGDLAKKWVKFCMDYSTKSFEDGLFIVEVQDYNGCIGNDNVAVIDYADFVSVSDVQLFSSYLLYSEERYTSNWKEYISVLVAQICETDAQLAAELLSSCNFRADSVFSVLKKISEYPEFEKRGCNPNSKSVLSYVRDNNKDEIEHRIWRTQVQVLYPIIELERIDIITVQQKRIQEVLDKYTDIQQYGNRVTDYRDVEIGTLDFMVKNGRISIGDFQLRNKISKLHEYRNLIAHSCTCSNNDVDQLFSYMK